MGKQNISLSFSPHEPLNSREEFLASIIGGMLHALANYELLHTGRGMSKTALGMCDSKKLQIRIRPQRYACKLEVILHELLHAMNFDTSHEQIEAITQTVMELLVTRYPASQA